MIPDWTPELDWQWKEFVRNHCWPDYWKGNAKDPFDFFMTIQNGARLEQPLAVRIWTKWCLYRMGALK